MRAEEAAEAACALIGKAWASRAIVTVAIDGLGGAGKSTLAVLVGHGLKHVSIVRVDDFYRPLHRDEQATIDPEYGYRNFFDWERIRDSALAPLRAGTRASYQRLDWITGMLAEVVEVEHNPIIVVEGVYSSRPELRAMLDLAIFIETPREIRRARMIARGQNSTDWIGRWMAAEDWYLENIRPHEKADLVVAGF